MNRSATSGSLSEDLRRSFSGLGLSTSVGGAPQTVAGMGHHGAAIVINSPLQQARATFDSNHSNRPSSNIEAGIRPSMDRTKAQNELLSHYW